MARGKTLSVVFKSNFQNQAMLLPPDLNEMIAGNHPVRVINEVLEKVDISELIKLYKPGGTSSYHPRMLLKVLVYGYINNIYSSRKIEEAVSQNINFMWLAGMSTPDHREEFKAFRPGRGRYRQNPDGSHCLYSLINRPL